MAVGSVGARLAELGLDLPQVPTPVASYVPAVVGGASARGIVHTSGQLPFTAGELLATGKVGEGGGLVSPELAQECARTCALNAIAALGTVVDLDDIARILKVVVFVASDPSFTNQPVVANGASDLLADVFGEPHARSAVGVSVLPLDAPVEVELVAEVTVDEVSR